MYYAIQVTSSKEEYIIKFINERVDKSLYNEVFLPKREDNIKVNGEWTIVNKIIFPGYIFVDTDSPKEFAFNLYALPQYARMLGREKHTGSFIPLVEEECVMLDTMCNKSTNRILKTSYVSIKEGKIVRVISGELFGVKGVVKKIDLHHRNVIVTISILHQSVDVLFPINFVRESETQTLDDK